MNEYISQIKRLGPNDVINGRTFNRVIEELQHNIDLLYNQHKSSHITWNLSELIFGNMLDTDATGQKRFVNGGKFDSLEKILSFEPSLGDVYYEEKYLLNNNDWLKWSIPSGQTINTKLIRNIAIPEAMRHQNLLIAIKFAVYEDVYIVNDEQYDIYINGIYSGTGSSGTRTVNGITEAKTIYGVYHLTGTESNIEVMLVRSSTNAATPDKYVVRISNMFVGLHTLGVSSFTMNYPLSGSSFSTSDINNFYDFENNAVNPIPSFLVDGHGGTGSLVVNISAMAPGIQSTYYVGLLGNGNYTGIDSSNRMPVTDFFNIDSFPASVVNVDFEQSLSYGTFNFDNGNFLVNFNQNTTVSSLEVNNSSSVTIVPVQNGTTITISDITCTGKSRLSIGTCISGQELMLVSDNVEIHDSSLLNITTGTFGMPLTGSGLVSMDDGSEFNLTLTNSSLTNANGLIGFGLSLRPLYIDRFSYVNIVNNNLNSLDFLITNSTSQDESLIVSKHSHFKTNGGFNEISTESVTKSFNAYLHSSIEINDTIQDDGGPTAFTDIDVQLFSTFGSTLSGGNGNLSTNIIESFIYEL